MRKNLDSCKNYKAKMFDNSAWVNEHLKRKARGLYGQNICRIKRQNLKE